MPLSYFSKSTLGFYWQPPLLSQILLHQPYLSRHRTLLREAAKVEIFIVRIQ